ncbi:hypothetical protein [Mangrovihabitans endophyticus]|uniref:Uncharacterized protein n=1 Tax=Mangrovihabitans endophyticus TaxID=1751298 RepID=A0A8J3FQV4_9ACTN|nr:hypothetical protein [Mangrovihabitans endophyticus]GGL12710.1 hypothetical protein GCM10012284_54260 [Mangrovihabitans endophyticus]
MTPTGNTPRCWTSPPPGPPPAVLRRDAETMIAALTTQTAPVVAAMGWAEDEIAAASRRHPGQADTLYHTFALLQPRAIGAGMGTAFVYRAHARELLERAAAGTDLRPASAAELCLALAETSLRAPLHGPATGLYLRAWQAAFPDHPLTAGHTGPLASYEQLYRPRIDELEADLRHRLRDPGRQAGDIDCAGRHHGHRVACRYARH